LAAGAIIPHLDNALTRNMNPLKAYVYVSMSVPIVSTKINNIDELSEWLTMASSHDEMIVIIESFLNGKNSAFATDDACSSLSQHTWDHRVDKVLSLIQKHLSRPVPQ